MQELVGRLTALDPAASESLKVVTYFDQLVEGRAGADAMLRGAALLTGTVVGHRSERREVRFGRDGGRLPAASPDGWATRPCPDGTLVWLEREGEPHANDAMVLDRLAHSLAVTSPTRSDGRDEALLALLDVDGTREDRERAAARLGLRAGEPLTLVTTPASDPAPGLPPGRAVVSAVVVTAAGLVRATLVRSALPVQVSAGRAGTATATGPDGPAGALRRAVTALRAATPGSPLVRAEDLGVLADLLGAADQADAEHPDVTAVGRALAHGWTLEALQALSEGESTRAVARVAGLHHSTVQSRVATLPDQLSWDPGTGAGRTRLYAALLVRRVLAVHFD